jgi:hypothetical protein
MKVGFAMGLGFVATVQLTDTLFGAEASYSQSTRATSWLVLWAWSRSWQ